jgi:hypothetical protein
VESTPGPPRDPAAARPDDSRLVVVGGYVMLLLFGVLQGLVGCFQFSRSLGTFPVAALAFPAGIGVTCVLSAWGMRRPLGGLMPGVGWFITSFVLAMGTPGGSIVITNTTAGKWFLFGGSICVAAGVVIAFALWSPGKTAAARRGGTRSGRLWPRGRPAPEPRAWKPDS